LRQYRLIAVYRMLTRQLVFKQWQAEHDRTAVALAEHRDPLALP
jgi:hypothetical protein